MGLFKQNARDLKTYDDINLREFAERFCAFFDCRNQTITKPLPPEEGGGNKIYQLNPSGIVEYIQDPANLCVLNSFLVTKQFEDPRSLETNEGKYLLRALSLIDERSSKYFRAHAIGPALQKRIDGQLSVDTEEIKWYGTHRKVGLNDKDFARFKSVCPCINRCINWYDTYRTVRNLPPDKYAFYALYAWVMPNVITEMTQTTKLYGEHKLVRFNDWEYLCLASMGEEKFNAIVNKYDQYLYENGNFPRCGHMEAIMEYYYDNVEPEKDQHHDREMEQMM